MMMNELIKKYLNNKNILIYNKYKIWQNIK